MSHKCDIYGCLREKNDNIIEGIPVADDIIDLDVCDFHADILNNLTELQYSTGYTYRNEVEVRIHPAR